MYKLLTLWKVNILSIEYFEGVMKKKCNSIADALELCLYSLLTMDLPYIDFSVSGEDLRNNCYCQHKR